MNLTNVQRDPKLEATLSRYMNECPLKGPVYAFQESGSTMEEAHALAAAGAVEGTLVWAARQTRGRGRFGRTWVSPEGGAYFSIILRPERQATEIPQLSLVAGLGLVEGLRQLGRSSPSIRWPNDVLIDSKKVAGILVEARSSANPERRTPNPERYVVIGIGVNVTTPATDLPETAISLRDVLQRSLHPHQVTGAFWRRFAVWYDVWTQQGFPPVREALRPHLALFGEVVRIDQQQATSNKRQEKSVEGQALDIDEAGRLLVRLDSGVVKAFEVGEVTLLR